MKELAIHAAKEAGKILMENFHKKHQVSVKAFNEIVTEVDVMAEKKIISILREKFPDHQILAEESGLEKTDSEYQWIIDPLDGTKNYSIRHPFFNVSIGLVKSKEIILGVVYAPVTDELYVAEKGKGSFLNGEKISVSDNNDFSKTFVTYCHGKQKKDIEEILAIMKETRLDVQEMTRFKASALELAYLAAGRVDVFIHNNMSPWDVAAGVLLVREAGGKVTDYSNNEWDLTKNYLLASNGKIHEEILNRINSALKK